MQTGLSCNLLNAGFGKFSNGEKRSCKSISMNTTQEITLIFQSIIAFEQFANTFGSKTGERRLHVAETRVMASSHKIIAGLKTVRREGAELDIAIAQNIWIGSFSLQIYANNACFSTF